MTPLLKQVKKYQRFSQTKSSAHYLHADKLMRKHTLLCGFVLLIAGAAILATITKPETNIEIKLFTAFLSVIAVVLSSFLTFVRFSKIAQRHKDAAVAYEANALNLDTFLVANAGLETAVPQRALKELDEIATKLHQIAQTAPRLQDQEPGSRYTVNN